MCFYDFIGASNILVVEDKHLIMSYYKLGDKLYLEAINTRFIMLDPGIDLLSVEHLPKVIGVSSSYTNMSNDFSYEICHSM